MKLLAIYGSPRIQGNSELLLDNFLEGAKASGCRITRLYVRDLNIFPCTACGECEKTGYCPLQDDMQIVYPLLLDTDALVVATPVYFYGVPAQLKALIDRCQLIWQKNKKKKPLFLKPGYLISVGGAKGQHAFDGVILTIKYFFLTLGVKLEQILTYAGVDAAGAIKQHPSALNEVHTAGGRLCSK
ncbi:MAG: flavodoxin family protein [Candidatus Desulfofervidaceae bacterium]|nr:flavodoxin family protein [Candidatus Desulfofervidaceae bacterium]